MAKKYRQQYLKYFDPFVLKKNHSKVLLLLHGFGVSPQLFQDFAETFHQKGFDIYAPHLTGKIDSLYSFACSTRQEWLAKSFAAYEKLSSSYDTEKITLIGFSMGALAALKIAMHKPVRQLILLAPFLGFTLHLEKILSTVIPFFPPWPFLLIPNKSPDCTKPRAEKVYCYGFTPLKAVRELLELRNELRNELKKDLKLPQTLCLHGLKDRVADFQHTAELFGQRAQVSFEPLANSRHYLLQDIEKEFIYQRIANFLNIN